MGLFKPAWMKESFDGSREYRLMLESVGRIKTQEKLAEVAVTAPYPRTRIHAVSLLKDQSILEDLARNCTIPDVREAAVRKLTNQSLLADFAQNDNDDDVRRAATVKLTDHAILENIAKNDTAPRIRLAALEKMYNPRDIPALLEKITDCTVIAYIAQTALKIPDRMAAQIKLFMLMGAKEHQEEHEWEELDCCLKKCKICGVLEYDHNYIKTFSPTGDDYELGSGYKCNKCGHSATAYGRGGDTRQTGLVGLRKEN